MTGPAARTRLSRAALPLALATLSLALAACGSGGGAGTTAPAGAPSSASPSASPSGPLAPPAAQTRSDSDAGAAPLRTAGGDNSVQDYGAEAAPADLQAAALALHTYLDARARGDWTAACAQLASAVHRQLAELTARAGGPHRGCAAALARLSAAAPPAAARAEAAAADVAALRVQGNRGFLLYRGAQAKPYATPMTHGGGGWRLASIAAIPLEP